MARKRVFVGVVTDERATLFRNVIKVRLEKGLYTRTSADPVLLESVDPDAAADIIRPAFAVDPPDIVFATTNTVKFAVALDIVPVMYCEVPLKRIPLSDRVGEPVAVAVYLFPDLSDHRLTAPLLCVIVELSAASSHKEHPYTCKGEKPTGVNGGNL
jgi:hypothetical protein